MYCTPPYTVHFALNCEENLRGFALQDQARAKHKLQHCTLRCCKYGPRSFEERHAQSQDAELALIGQSLRWLSAPWIGQPAFLFLPSAGNKRYLLTVEMKLISPFESAVPLPSASTRTHTHRSNPRLLTSVDRQTDDAAQSSAWPIVELRRGSFPCPVPNLHGGHTIFLSRVDPVFEFYFIFIFGGQGLQHPGREGGLPESKNE